MKKFTLVLYLFLFLFVCAPAVQAEQTHLTYTGKEKSESGRPRMPQKNNEVTAYFDGSIILINFMENEGMGHIVLRSESGFYFETVGDTAETISVPCPMDEAPYDIVIVTERGNIYEGIIK